MRGTFQHMEPEPGRCQILSQHGLVTTTLTENVNVFGDMPGSKLVGATLCALAHVMAPRGAIRAFQDFFLDRLFQRSFTEYPGSREALCTFLTDNYRSILNEGTAHQFNERFDEAISKLNLTRRAGGFRPDLNEQGQGSVSRSEALLIKGLFRWLFQRDDLNPYYTRSATVRRLAPWLKYVGYQIAEVRVWDGSGKQTILSRGLILVTGGSFVTDRMLEEESLVWALDFVNNYRWETVGAMLWKSAAQEVNESHHETFQQDFEDAYRITKGSLLCVRWDLVQVQAEEIQAFVVWKDAALTTSSRIALRLASTLFPESADRIAPFYEKIATERYLSVPKFYAQRKGNKYDTIPNRSKELQWFQALTASICISILSQAAGNGFETMKHSTTLDLTQWKHLTRLCTQVDALIQGGCLMSEVVAAIATIHCAADIRQTFKEGNDPYDSRVGAEASSDSTVIGWRNGRYAIMPALLYSMERPLERALLGLRCADAFIANIPTQQDGAIRYPNGLSGMIMFYTDSTIEALKLCLNSDPEKAETMMEADSGVFLGQPSSTAADKPLYVSLERPSHAFGEPFTSLCGRIEGDSLGHVSIQDILKALAQSWSDAQGNDYKFCAIGAPHEDRNDDEMELVPAHRDFNMAPSRYCQNLELVSGDGADSSPKHNVHVQVKNNTPWAIFLAGQSPLHNRLAFDCIQCAVHTGDDSSAQMREGFTTLIGYK
ncbi:hypothetical protein CC86DRAFT_156236 [Ophiobolus disseminans]|uniref:Uncharacterized protein n=1 Tax=Ophiobolus disseminans TaxID=1469910 RepID=A0A6A6ZDV2_9PLEO|nr:hypothetical protein CC86DRAFT_156236 [Ophiobolus disseminans]